MRETWREGLCYSRPKPQQHSPPRPYGAQTELATATLNDDKSWLGERYDADAGLQYLNARYYDPELAMFLQPDWFEVMQPGVGTNRYAYAWGDPVNARDPGGNACTKLNSGSGYCDRAALYDQIDGIIGDKTRFFYAAARTAELLAALDNEGSGLVVSESTKTNMNAISETLEEANMQAAAQIANGELTGPGLDHKMVHMEQSIVQSKLDELASADPGAYQTLISEINSLINSDSLMGTVGMGYVAWRTADLTDYSYVNNVVKPVVDLLGRPIDFSNQSDREAVGRKLVDRAERDAPHPAPGGNGSASGGGGGPSPRPDSPYGPQ